MAPSLKAYRTDGTLLATISPSAASWSHRTGEDGSGQVTVRGTTTSSVMGETRPIRVNDGTRDVFAFVPTTKTRRQVEASTEVDLSGPGVKWLLHAGQVYQEDTSDEAEPTDTRWFGWMSGDYDDSSWDTPEVWGQFIDGGGSRTVAAGDFPDPYAYYITPSASLIAPRDWYARRTFTLASDVDVVIAACCDDEYRLFLDGTELINTLGGGHGQWLDYQSISVSLSAGTHTIAALCRNIPWAYATTHETWLLLSVVAADDTGAPASANQQYELYTTATGGTFTLTHTPYGQTTAALDYNATSTEIRDALAALPVVGGTNNVSVSGSGTSGSPWVIEFIGLRASIGMPFSINSSLTGGTATFTETQVGAAAQTYLRSDANWVILDDPADAPGLTPGEILGICVAEAQARGTTVFDEFTEGYTDAADSDSVSWPEELTFPVALPADVHRVVVMLEEFGYQIDMDPDLTLQAWVSRGSDVSGSVAFTAGTAGVTDIEAAQDETSVSNVIRTRTEQGWYEATDSSSITARGRWEAGLSLNDFGSILESRRVTSPILDDLATPPRTTRLTVPSEGSLLPYDDFDMGDVISAPAFGTSGFEATDMRVVGISGVLAELSIEWTVEVID